MKFETVLLLAAVGIGAYWLLRGSSAAASTAYSPVQFQPTGQPGFGHYLGIQPGDVVTGPPSQPVAGLHVGGAPAPVMGYTCPAGQLQRWTGADYVCVIPASH
jgi:hypothetical protein